MKRNSIFKLALFSMLAALAYAMTYVSVPLPAAKVHLGNFVCVLSALLFGGFIGGLSAAVGMTLNDMVLGYHWDTWIRTFFSKLVLGLVVGFVFSILLKKTKMKIMYAVVISLVIGILFGIGTEVLLRIITKSIIYNGINPAVAETISKLPANFITGAVSLGLGSLVYYPAYMGLSQISSVDDIVLTRKTQNVEEIKEENEA